MLVKQLAAALAPFKLLCQKNALAAHYKAIELGPNLIRGASPFGRLEVKADTRFSSPVHIDAWTFINVVGSLPSEVEFAGTVADGVLSWKAGAARGKLATIAVAEMPAIDFKVKEEPASGRPKVKKGWQPSGAFTQALTYGSLACGQTSMATIGAYGVVIDNRKQPPRIMASDNTTISSCALATPTGPLPFNDTLVLAPDAVALLQSVLTTEGVIKANENSLLYSDDWCQLQVNRLPALKQDFSHVMSSYDSTEVTAKITPDAIAAFIKRASALAENRKDTHVTLSAEKGQLGLSFSEGAASADEIYLVDSLDIPDLAEIRVDAAKLARALSSANEIVLDHIQRGVLILWSREIDFRYLISGRSEAKAD